MVSGVIFVANKEFGKKLRSLRIANDLTQQQVADILGLKNKSTLGNWEIGNSEPDAMTFLHLCDIYKVDNILLEFAGTSVRKGKDIDYDLFQRLDDIDKAEIRGEMKHMLKADKYNHVVSDNIADDIVNELKQDTPTPTKRKSSL